MNSEQKYERLKEIILNWDRNTISIDDIYILINRITHDEKKRYFGFTQAQKMKSRLKYHRHLVILLEKRGVISQTEFVSTWKINRSNVN